MKKKSGFEFAPTPPAGSKVAELAEKKFERNFREPFVEKSVGEGHGSFKRDTAIAGVYAETDFGGPRSKYKNNEDSMFALADTKSLVVGLADGAGGSDQGQLASKIVTEELILRVQDRKSKKKLLEHFSAINEDVVLETNNSGYAAAVVCEIMPDGQCSIVWVGDTKVMTVRNGTKLPEGTTHFHNMAQQFIDAGFSKPEEYYVHPQQNIITGALGRLEKEGSQQPDEIDFIAKKGDQIILASDGLWDIVSEYEVEQLAHQFQGEVLQKKLYELAYSRANLDEPFSIQHNAEILVKDVKKSAADNITIAVIDVRLLKDEEETSSDIVSPEESS